MIVKKSFIRFKIIYGNDKVIFIKHYDDIIGEIICDFFTIISVDIFGII